MAISTVAGLTAARKQIVPFFKSASSGATGVLITAWTSGGAPAAGSPPANTTTGVVPDRTTLGALAFLDAASGDTTLLASAKQFTAPLNGGDTTWLLCDRLWHAGAFNPPTAGAYAGVVGAALTRSTDAIGVEVYVEITTVLSALPHTLTITYTNQSGATGRTATVTLPASAGVARVYGAALQIGDTGVAQITAMSGSASPPTGGFNVVLAKTHATVEGSLRKSIGAIGPKAFFALGSTPIPNGACLYWMAISGNGALQPFSGVLEFAHG